MRKMGKALLSGIVLGTILPTGAIEFGSGDQTVALVELFTSEGCSSCPPADTWISKLKDNPELWRRFVPVVFHVDYWDRLGWPDPFALKQNAERQRRYQQEGAISQVYTPGMILQGREWRNWWHYSEPGRENDNAGPLWVNLENDTARASFQPVAADLATLRLNWALLGFDLQTEVKRGENRGRRLQHDFVVLNKQTQTANRDESGFHWQLAWRSANTHGIQPAAIAFWVTPVNSQRPLQATGGWLQPTASTQPSTPAR